MKKNLFVISTGFALFSMFFGSGNLVFPISVGLESQGHYLLASLGIFLTGVLIPFLGVFGMVLYQGELSSFFRYFGKIGIFWFSFFALALMGPFGVLARCLTVAHGAIKLFFPEIPLVAASLGMCVIIFLVALNKSKVLTILGTYLTPFLLLSIGAIAFFGLSKGQMPVGVAVEGFSAFKNGFFQGYQTMDLLAAFFFSSFVLKSLQKSSLDKSHGSTVSLSAFSKSAIIGSSILALVYIALVFLGWSYSLELKDVLPQERLGRIAMETLGPFAAPCVCVALILACLTTAIVLTSLFADFLRKDVLQEKIGNKTALAATLAISFCVSTLEFSGIAQFIGPILEAIYPMLILLTLVNIIQKLWVYKTQRNINHQTF